MNIDPKDLHYEYSTKGYTLYYKGEPIGGVGCENEVYFKSRVRRSRSNLTLFKNLAELEKNSILHGRGQRYMLDKIAEIQEKIAREVIS